jgi:tetratricopeptide (TPR) repeat protein
MPIMATKIGRNDPCHCGSGKKYKRCCLEEDQEGERFVREAAAAALAAEQAEEDEFNEWSDKLDDESNAVIDLIEAGKLDEAEQAAHELIANYPEVHDGYDRLGMVYEARKESKKAADCYRKVVEFIEENPTDYDPEMLANFQRLVQELDPPNSPDPAA